MFAARLIARGSKKKKDDPPTFEGEEKKRDWCIEQTDVDSNNSKAISLPYLTTVIKVT